MEKSRAAWQAANPRTAGTGSRPSNRIASAVDKKAKYGVAAGMAALAGGAAGAMIAGRNKPKRFKNGDKAVRDGVQVTYNNGSWYSK